jgi:hypothetical protein
MGKFVEIRSYTLQPGSGAAFDRLVAQEAVPMLKRWGVDVVAFGPSQHDPDSYHLIRSYLSLAERQKSQDEFYGSQEWLTGPRAAILALIENYTSVVIEMDESTVAGLRATHR